VAVDRERRIGLVPRQDEIDRGLGGLQGGILQRPLQIDGRIAGREQQRVALAQGHAEMLGQQQDHVAAGLRAAALDEGQVLLRDLRLERELELAETALLPPVTDERADGRGAMAVHVRHATGPPASFQLPVA
jgi:hypothetical protein